MEILAVTFKRIRQLTNNNDHGGALIEAANALGCKDIAESLEHIQRQHIRLGHLPADLYTRRYGLYQDILKFARRKLCEADFRKLYAAF